MSDGSSGHHRRWAPEWIAVLTLAVAIIALGGGLFASLNAMEGRIRDDMRTLRGDMQAMERGIREDMRGMESGIREDMRAMESGIRKDMRAMESGIRGDVRELRGDVGTLRERVSRLEVRFDEEFPPRAASVPSPTTGEAGPPQHTRL